MDCPPSIKKGDLADIQPSFDPILDLEYYPAAAICRNGEYHERVLFIDEDDAKKIGSYDWLKKSTYWRDNVFIEFHMIESVKPSKWRLPREIVQDILSMSIYERRRFNLQTKNGENIYNQSWNIKFGQLDFLMLPGGQDPSDIVSVNWVFNEMKESVTTLIEFGDIRICVFPSSIESEHNFSTITEKGYAEHEARNIEGERKVNRITRMNQINKLAMSKSVHTRISFQDEIRRKQHHISGASPKRLDKRLKKDLIRIDPGKEREYPCKVTLRDGTMLENVVLVKKGIVGKRLQSKYSTHERDINEYYVNADDIVAIEESPNAIPAFLRKRIPQRMPEWPLEFKIQMNDGTAHAYQHCSPENGFLDLPSPYQTSDIISLNEREGYASHSLAYIADSIYSICVFK
ncbi:MAG: hypothetical protein SA339_00035 [Methanomassiliicoccus sp.]|nr:hypothetical protein [Methanomassiliicoccus sp.]